jgi:hypothetical protein
MARETPDRGGRQERKKWSRAGVAHTQIADAIALPLRFSTNLRYLRILSRFVPAIPTCGGFLYLLILTLDGRGRLGLALKSSARRYRSPPGSPKRGLGRAPRCTPARGTGLFASGGTWWRDSDVPNEGPANRPGGMGVDRTTGLRPTRWRTFAATSRESRRRLIFKRVFRRAADMRN